MIRPWLCGENAIGATIQQYPSIGSEEILVCGAEVIIQSAMGTENIGQQRKAAEVFWSRFSNLPAVANSRIYVIESDTVLRLGPRLAKGVATIARCLHPEVFSNSIKNNAPQKNWGKIAQKLTENDEKTQITCNFMMNLII